MRVLPPILVLLLSLAGCRNGGPPTEDVAVEVDATASEATIRRSGRALLRRMARLDAADPGAPFRVFDHLYAPDGVTLLTKGPGGKYPHHHGVFCAWNKTRALGRTFDFWHGRDGAVQRLRRWLPVAELEGASSLGCEIAWVAGDGQEIVRETRIVQVSEGVGGAAVYDYELRLEPAPGVPSVALQGDAQHAGFQFRAVADVADREKETIWLRSDGAAGGKDDLWTDTRWVACRYAVGDVPVVVLHCDHPSNPKPVVYSTRAYGRFGAFFERTLDAGQPLTLRYRLVVLPGDRQQSLDPRHLDAFAASFGAAVR